MNAVSLKMNNASFGMYKKEWVFHLIFWILWISCSVIFTSWIRIFPDNGITFILITLIIPFYINANFLIPRYLKRLNWLKYVLLLAGLLIAVNVIKALFLVLSFELRGLEYEFYAEFQKWVTRDFRDLGKFIFSGTAMLLYLSFTYRIGKDWVISERVKDRLVSEKLSMELALLKSQVNPHFLFNTLNNIYAMALEEKAGRTADGVAQMGTLMRYSLHDTQADFISLQKELDYIARYIEMQKLRIIEDGKLSIHLSLPHLEMSHEKIAPMILIPFIENAFKYGVSTVKESSIEINISLSGSVLSMQVHNKLHSDSRLDSGGLGLKNVENRLKLMYPDRHKLSCGLKGNTYSVDLEINLDK